MLCAKKNCRRRAKRADAEADDAGPKKRRRIKMQGARRLRFFRQAAVLMLRRLDSKPSRNGIAAAEIYL